MARHAAPRTPRRSALLRAGLGVTVAGAAVFGAGATAQAAAPLPLPVGSSAGTDASAGAAAAGEGLAAAGAGALSGVTHGIGPLTRLQLDPLANTGVDPLDNGLGTQVADFAPIGTDLVTGHVSRGGAVADLPVVGPLTRGLLP